MIHIKRIYAPPEKSDGYRVLVDRLWPRGVAKAHAQVDLWLKDVSPSAVLRKWFNHEPPKWAAFRQRYHDELHGSAAYDELVAIVAKHATVTLLYAAKDETHNQASVLRDLLAHAIR